MLAMPYRWRRSTGVLLAASGHWLVAVVAMAVWGVPVSVAILNAITLRAKVTPDHLQSRVNTAGRMAGFRSSARRWGHSPAGR